jgi:hypothetical protein
MERQLNPIDRIEEYLKEASIAFDRGGNILYLQNITNCTVTICSVADYWIYVSTFNLLPKSILPSSSLTPFFTTLLLENCIHSLLGKFYLAEDYRLEFGVDFRIKELNEDLLLEALYEIAAVVEEWLPQILAAHKEF